MDDLAKVKALWHEAAGKCRLQEIRIRVLEIALRRIADHIGELDNADCARIAWQALNPLAPGAAIQSHVNLAESYEMGAHSVDVIPSQSDASVNAPKQP